MQRRAPLQHRLSCQTEPAPEAAAALLPAGAAAVVTARGGGAATRTLRQSLRQTQLGTAVTAVPAAAAAARRSVVCMALSVAAKLEVTRPVVTQTAAAVAAVAAVVNKSL
jgi:hypothetical protein